MIFFVLKKGNMCKLLIARDMLLDKKKKISCTNKRAIVMIIDVNQFYLNIVRLEEPPHDIPENGIKAIKIIETYSPAPIAKLSLFPLIKYRLSPVQLNA